MILRDHQHQLQPNQFNHMYIVHHLNSLTHHDTLIVVTFYVFCRVSYVFSNYAYNLGASGSNRTKLYQATCRGAVVITWVQLLDGVLQQNSGGQKLPKFSAIFDNFQL